MSGQATAMTESIPAPATPGRWTPVRRVILVVAGTGAAGALAALLGAASPALMPVTLSLLSAAGLGLVAGFMARGLLAPKPRLLRPAAALAALTIGLALVHALTGGLAGVQPSGGAATDWGGLTLLGLGAAACWLALRAWGSAPRPSAPARPEQASARAEGRPKRRLALPALGLRLPDPRAWRARLERTVRRRRAAVRLIGQTEHRCPYCLEIVEHHDRRGVTTCPDCKTRHHADCWAVTGMCQVPHQHS